MIVLQFLAGLLGLGILVVIHEYGHLLAARLAGIQVEAFSIGFGRAIFSKLSRKGIEYRIGMLPFGGYVRMKGETQFRDAISNNLKEFPYEEGSFFSAHPLKRLVVAAAGPLINLIFAVLVLALIAGIGYDYRSVPAEVILLEGETAARQAGLQDGDRIVSLNGQPVESFVDLQRLVSASGGQQIELVYLRDGSEQQSLITPRMDTRGVGIIGVYAAVKPVFANLGPSLLAQGLQNGDLVISVNGQEISYSHEFAVSLDAGVGTIELEIMRDSRLLSLSIVPEYSEDLEPILDAEFQSQEFRTPQYGFFGSIAQGFREVGSYLSLSVRVLGNLFSGQGMDAREAVSGPLRISVLVGEVASVGFAQGIGVGLRLVFQFLAIISIALAFGNLLPIPLLDGGQILLYGFEAITKRKLNPKTVRTFNAIGMGIVFLLLILALFSDILFFTGR